MSAATPKTTPQPSSEGELRSSYMSYETDPTDSQAGYEFVEKMHALQDTLEGDLLACDAKWTLFVAAAQSYRYDTQLQPFPPRFVSEQAGCNIDALIAVINDTPKLRVVLQNIIEQNYEEFDIEVLDLLHWVLVVMHRPLLRLMDEEEVDTLLLGMGQLKALKPTHAFEVCQPLTCYSEENFRASSLESTSKLAFHGRKLDSYFSLIHNGFRQHVDRDCTENGILLSTELVASLNHSPNGAGWGASSCGSMIACVSVCEFIDSPEHVLLMRTLSEASGDAACSDILVRNVDSVRLRFLLFYGSRFPDDENKPDVPMVDWVYRHKYGVSLACYLLLLASIGIANSGSGGYFRHLFIKKVNLLLEFCKRVFVTE